MKSLFQKLKLKVLLLLGLTIDTTEPIHEWFSLSYCSYQVLPRSVLQSTPKEWQKKFIKLMDELNEMGYVCPQEGHYEVFLRDKNGRFIEDVYKDYERGRRRINPKMYYVYHIDKDKNVRHSKQVMIEDIYLD